MLDHGWPLAYLYGSFKMRNQTKTILCHEEIWKSFYTIWTMVITIINTSSLRIEIFSPSFWARTKSKLQLKLIPERRPRDGTPHEYRDKSSGPSVPKLINMIARINQGVRRGNSLITTKYGLCVLFTISLLQISGIDHVINCTIRVGLVLQNNPPHF